MDSQHSYSWSTWVSTLLISTTPPRVFIFVGIVLGGVGMVMGMGKKSSSSSSSTSFLQPASQFLAVELGSTGVVETKMGALLDA